MPHRANSPAVGITRASWNAPRSSRVVGAAATCVLALLATGCATDEDTTADATSAGSSSAVVKAATETSPAAPTESSTESTTEPTATDAATAPDGFHPSGWGAITVDLTPNEITELGYSREEVFAMVPGKSLCSTDRVVPSGGEPVYVTFKSGAVYGVSNSWHLQPSPGSATSEGLKQGDPVSEITRIYPGATEVATEAGTIYLVTDPADPQSALSLTAEGGTVQEIRGGDASFAKHFESCIDFSGTGG